jgi:hypothetical protein
MRGTPLPMAGIADHRATLADLDPADSVVCDVVAGYDPSGGNPHPVTGPADGFGVGVNLGGDGSIVEGLRVFGGPLGNLQNTLGIAAKGIVKGNTVVGIGMPRSHSDQRGALTRFEQGLDARREREAVVLDDFVKLWG